MHGALPAMTAMPPPATWREIRGGGHVLVPGRASRHNLLRGFPADFRGRWPYDRTHKKEQKSTCSALHDCCAADKIPSDTGNSGR